MSADFDVSTLAAYLHLTPAQVQKMADRDRVPARKVGGEWKFSRAEIHHWLETRIGALDGEELEKLETRLDDARHVDDEQEYTIAGLLPSEAVAVPLEARTSQSVIRAMVDLAATTGMLWDTAKMADALRAREQLHPTAMDNGVALLHPRRPLPGIMERPFLALGRTATGIPFGDSRGGLTDLFFLVASTSDRGHLQTLARLSRLLADPLCLAELRDAPNAQTARDVLIEREQELSG